MAKFTQVASFRTEDGEIFATAEAAEAHANKLQFAGEIKVAAESYCNANKMIGRKRAAQLNAVSDFLGFYLGWDKVAVEQTVFDPVVEAPAEGAPAVEGEVAPVEAAEGEVAEDQVFA